MRWDVQDQTEISVGAQIGVLGAGEQWAFLKYRCGFCDQQTRTRAWRIIDAPM